MEDIFLLEERDGIGVDQESRGLGDVNKGQEQLDVLLSQ